MNFLIHVCIYFSFDNKQTFQSSQTRPGLEPLKSSASLELDHYTTDPPNPDQQFLFNMWKYFSGKGGLGDFKQVVLIEHMTY